MEKTSGPDPAPSAPPAAATAAPLRVGDQVVVVASLRYLKTAEPMPMLRPPDLIDAGEVGCISEQRAGDLLAVRFRRGTFLLGADQLRAALPPSG